MSIPQFTFSSLFICILQVFLASPFPLPETMIAANPEFYYHFTLTGWIGTDAKDAKAGNAQWVKESIAPYLDPVRGKDRIAAACEDVCLSTLQWEDEHIALTVFFAVPRRCISRYTTRPPVPHKPSQRHPFFLSTSSTPRHLPLSHSRPFLCPS